MTNENALSIRYWLRARSRLLFLFFSPLLLLGLSIACMPPPKQNEYVKKQTALPEPIKDDSDQKPEVIPQQAEPGDTVVAVPETMTPAVPLPDSTIPTPVPTPTPTPGAEPLPVEPTPICKLPYAAGAKILKLQVAGAERQFRLFIPKKYDGKTYLPLVLNFHGSSNDVSDFAKGSGMEVVAEREGFIVAGIAGVNKEWNVPPVAGKPDEVLNAKMTIEFLAKTICVDEKRVYATGFSGGGRTSSLLGCKIPEKFAAIAPVAGVRWPGSCVGSALPVFAIHGLKDATNSYKGDGNPRWNESVESALQSWADNNACNKTRIEDPQSGTLQVYHYKDCKEGSTVKLLRMYDQGHTYPTGKPINTADEVWWFLKNFKRK